MIEFKRNTKQTNKVRIHSIKDVYKVYGGCKPEKEHKPIRFFSSLDHKRKGTQ